MFDSIKKKINVRTLMGQSEALEENTTELKKGITTLVGLFGERESLKGYSPIQRAERKLPVEAGEEEEKKKKKEEPNLLDVLGKILGPLFKILSTLASLLGPLLGPALGLGALAAAFLISPKTASKYLLRNVIKNILRFGKKIFKFLKGIFDNIFKIFKGIFDNIGKFFRKIFNFIGDSIKAVKNFISDKILKPIRGAIDDLINSKFFKNIKNIFNDMVQSVKNFIDRGFKAIRGVIDDIFTKFKSFVGDLVDKFLKLAKGFADNLIDLGRRVGNAVITPLRETVQTLQKEASETIIKRLKKSFTDTVNYVVEGTVSNVTNIINGITERKIGPFKLGDMGIPGTDINIGRMLNNVKEGVVKFIREPQKTLTEFIEIAGKRGSEVVNIFQEGTSEALNQLSNARQSFTKTLTDAYSGMQKFGTNIAEGAGKVADRVKGGLDYVGQLGDRFKNAFGVFISSAQEKVVKPVADTVGQVAQPLINAAKDPETYKRFFSGVSDTVKPLVDNVLTPIRNAQAGLLKLIRKLPGGRAFVKGFTASTSRIDTLFALADTVITYGQKIRNKDNEQVEASILGEGQSIGTTLLRVMGGFGGSAILGGAGTAIPIPGLGIAGSILGGVLGEEAGMLVAGNLSETEPYSQIMDPFIGGQVFEKPKPEDSIMSLFGSSPEPKKPTGEGGGYGIMPTRRQRSMTDMEEYPEYDIETNIIILRQRAAQSQQVIASHGGGGSGISIKTSSDTSLNTFKTITMSKLTYV